MEICNSEFIGDYWQNYNINLSSKSKHFYIQAQDKENVQKKICEIINSVWKNLSENKIPSLDFPKVAESCEFDYQLSCFVLKNQKNAKRKHEICKVDPSENTLHFAYLLKILERVYDYLENNQYATKRVFF